MSNEKDKAVLNDQETAKVSGGKVVTSVDTQAVGSRLRPLSYAKAPEKKGFFSWLKKVFSSKSKGLDMSSSTQTRV